MKQLTTKGIILTRTNFREADRIITILTPDYGKLRLLARGVRKIKSKLAGGLELFSVSHITFIKGRGEICTLISTRLITHYDKIPKDIDRTMIGYELIRQFNKVTEEATDESYFNLVEVTLESLNNPDISLGLISQWFEIQLLRLGGQIPNLKTDGNGEELKPDTSYSFDFDDMVFSPTSQGNMATNQIKFLRLAFSGNKPEVLQNITGINELSMSTQPLVQTMFKTHVRL